jgi:hypothetical protein
VHLEPVSAQTSRTSLVDSGCLTRGTKLRIFRLFSVVAGLGLTAFLFGVRSPSDVSAMATAVRSAIKEATRTSDAALGCAALEKELVATMSGPAMQKYAARVGAAAQKSYTALQNGGPMTGRMAATIAASLSPGARSNQASALVEILPQLARSERLIALAFTKRCSWVIGVAKGI